MLPMAQSSHGLSRRVVCAGALILLLLLLALKAGREGLSNFYAQSAYLEIKRWSGPGQNSRESDRTRVMQYLRKSLRYSSDNPWSLEESGTLQLRRMNAATDPGLAVAAARSANVDFRMALLQRPTSPFTWANFALSKLYLGERDDELFQALRRAEELGPWEPEVQQSVVFAGLAVWNRLNSAQQAAVVRAMGRGAHRDPGKFADIAKMFDRIDLFCAIKITASQGREVCNRIGKSEKKALPAKKGQMP